MPRRPRNPVVLLGLGLFASAALGGLAWTTDVHGHVARGVLGFAPAVVLLLAVAVAGWLGRHHRLWPVVRSGLAILGTAALGLVLVAAGFAWTFRPRLRGTPGRPQTNLEGGLCHPEAFWDHLARARVQAAFPGLAAALTADCDADLGRPSVRTFRVRVGPVPSPDGHTRLVIDEEVRIAGSRSAPAVALGPYRRLAEATVGARAVAAGSRWLKRGGDQVCLVGAGDEVVGSLGDLGGARPVLADHLQPTDGRVAGGCWPAPVVARNDRLLLRYDQGSGGDTRATSHGFELPVPDADPYP